MCGIVGVAGNVGTKEEKVFKDLLIADSVRGTDSTGIVTVPRHQGVVKTAKQLGNPFELLDHSSFNRAFQGFHRAIIGHNRWGTIGKVSKANAHPFEFDTVVGVHNGTVTTKYKLVDGNTFDTDSEAIYNHLDKKGLNSLMENMGGAWTLVWWDKLEESINFLRNKERPLWLAFTEDSKTVFWASECKMLEWALDRNGIKTKEPFSLGEDVHLSILIKNGGVMEKPHAVAMPSKFVQPVYQQNNNVPWHQQQQKPTSNVTHLPVHKVGKEGVAPVTAGQNENLGSKSSYGGSKTVLLSVISLVENDGFGSSYLVCKDAQAPWANVRWYYDRYTEPEEVIGEEILADLSQAIIRFNEPMYFKAVNSTVQLVETSGAAAVAHAVLEADDDGEPIEEVKYEDSRGRRIPYNDWLQKHGDCTFCSSIILPTDRHAFNAAGQVFCQDCMESDDVTQYTRFTKLVEKTASPL